MRILTEVDLNGADFYRDTFIELAWSFEQRNPPNRFYLVGGQMLSSFQHVKRPAHRNRRCLFVVVRPAGRACLEVKVLYRPDRGNC
jgi:hypothetical protein